jgi:phosphate transport system substrate-binding protein
MLASVAAGAMLSCSGKVEEGGAPKKAGAAVTVKGSDTMVQLVSAWAEAFMKTHPDAEVSVTGGGSGTGIAALINGTTDLCAASREMAEKEKTALEEKGGKPVESVVARDGISVVVNPRNPINELTMEQLRKIFTGAYARWSQAGGPDQDIIVLSRESSSGTYVFFQEHVLNKEDYTQKARLMPATSAIIQAVAADAGAIGYVGLGYAEEANGKVKILRVKKDAASPAITPSEETVKSGAYPVARALYIYANGTPSGAAKDFLDCCLSDAGQKIVRQTGYVTVK